MHTTEHEMTTIGYARVSTDGQTLQAQTEALHQAGSARIFADKISGAYSHKPQLAKAIAALGEGEVNCNPLRYQCSLDGH
jgi:DNA invertase Pin-like site-specific DNA recombinase